ncbi:MAG: FAD-binding oxidoreductase [Actinomycetota bacterium]|nr:FAD-binding oxidoreductase [Actinomycetota bacterium]
MPPERHDLIAIGGGIYGSLAAAFAARQGRSAVLLERAPRLLDAASAINQARVHNGYHYPRSFVTAARSNANFRRFVDDFGDAISRHEALYAIARQDSLVSPQQFERFCRLVGIPLSRVDDMTALADPVSVAALWTAEEVAFDADVLRSRIGEMVDEAGVDVRLGTAAAGVEPGNGLARVVTDDGAELVAPLVLNCTYAGLERLGAPAGRPLAPELLYELAEIVLVRPPAGYEQVGLTVMDGPFFSCIPFPARGCHSLTHVRYSPHVAAPADRFPWEALEDPPPTRHLQMRRAARRFAPWIDDAEYVGSLFAVKAIPPNRDRDDARPIILHASDANGTVVSVLGSKLDNVYDLLEWLATALR